MGGTAQTPSCFGWHDKLDPSCRRCAVRESCINKQGESRPPCFADMYDGNHPECKQCLDNSSCSEEHAKMVTPKIRIKRPAAVAEAAVAEAELPEPEDVEPVETVEDEAEEVEEEVVEEEASPYDDFSVEALREELTERGLDATGRRSVLQARLEEDDAKPKPKPAAKPAAKPAIKTVATPVAKPAVAPKPAAAPAPKPAVAPKVAPKPAAAVAPKAAPAVAAKPAPVAPKAAPQPIPAKASDADESNGDMMDASFKEVLAAMETGMAVVIARTGKDEWTMTLMANGDLPVGKAAAASGGKKLKGQAFWDEVLSPEYHSWYYEDSGSGKPWGEMTADEKTAYVNSLGIQYEPHADPRVNALHQVEALLGQLGIEKYKPEYKSSKARDAIKA